MSISGYTAVADNYVLDIRTNDRFPSFVWVLDNDTKPVANMTVTPIGTPGVYQGIFMDPTGVIFISDSTVRNSFKYLSSGATEILTFKYFVTAFVGSTVETSDELIATVTVIGVNDAPTAVSDSYSYTLGASLNMSVLANDTDPDLIDTKTIVALKSADGSITDTTPTDGLAITVNAGTISLNQNGTLNFTAANGFTGTSSFQYTIRDSGGLESTATVNLVPLLSAANDTYSLDEDTALIINPLLNDLGSSITKIQITSLPASASLILNGETGPETVTVNQEILVSDIVANRLSFAPSLNFNGATSFQYKVSDGTTFSNAATVTVNVNAVNDAPRLTNDTESVLDASAVAVPATTGLMANDSDPDNGDSISVVGARIMGGESFATDVTDNYGTLHVNSDGSYRFTANGISSFELAAGVKYIDTFEYQVKDAAGLTSNAQLAITITGRNQQPKAVTDNLFVDEGQTISGSLIANDFDIDIGDKIAVTSVKSSTNIAYGITGPTAINFDFGTLNIDRTGSYSFTANGLASIALKAGQEHLETFTYRITDGGGLASSASIEILIKGVNSEPAAKDDSADVNEDGALLAFNILSNDKDPDTGDVLHVSGVRKSSTDNFDTIPIDDDYGTLTLNADGTVSFQADGSASQALAAGVTATDSFTYQIKDEAGLSATATLKLTITGVNDEPIANDVYFSVQEGATRKGNLLNNVFEQDQGDTLTVIGVRRIGDLIFSDKASDAYGELSVDASGNFSFTADGSASNALAYSENFYVRDFEYQIRDAAGMPSQAIIFFTVFGSNDEPAAYDDSFELNQNETIKKDLLSNDLDPDTSDVLHVSGIRKSSTDNFVTTPIPDDYGTLTLNDDGTVSFQADGSASQALAKDETATDSFTYQIMDQDGLSATATLTLTITGVNDAPIARNDAYSYNNTAGSVFTVSTANGVLKHLDAGETVDDSDVDSTDILTVAGAGNVITTAAGQQVTLAAGGSFVYDAADGFYGHDSFDYTISDGNGGTSTATVNLTVTAPPKLADKFLINEIAVNTGPVTFTITTDNGADPNTVTTGPAHIEIIKNSNTATSSAELRSMQVEIVNPNGDLSVISMSQLVGLTVDKAGNALNLSSAITAGGSLELFEPNSNGLGVWVVYDSKGTIKLSGTYHDNAWHLGADVTQPIAVNLSSLTGESFDLFVANGAPLSDLHGIDTAQSWLTGVGALGTAPHALGSVSPYVPPEKLFAWYGGAQLLPASVPADVLALLAANQQFNASLASSADTVFARVYDTSLNNGVANGLDKVFIDNNDAGDWTYGPKAILSDGYKNIAAKDMTKFVANPLDPYDNMNPLQGTGKHGDVIASITNEDGQTIAIFSGTGTGGNGHDFLYGVDSDDVLLGASGDDFIYGSGGNDTLLGGSGGDSLSGAAGNDVLYGGTGKDKLLGGTGADVFVYRDTIESSVTLADVIGDFTNGVDKIDLSAIDAKTSVSGNQAFAFSGNTTVVKANSVTWFESNGNTIIQIDNTGNTVADMQLVLTGVSLGLTAADFIL